MTEKLYENDAYRFDFSAVVVSCRKNGDRFETVLDRTAFFPEGGGQSADRGTLNGVPVADVRMSADGEVVHILTAPLSVGETVLGKLDRAERFRKMQHHTGEHIVSGIVHSRFGAENVGFHLSECGMTMDFNRDLSREELDSIEAAANRAVWENRDVTAEVYPSCDLVPCEYRSKKAIDGPIRIVRIDGIDSCACCAPHVAKTGEIGAILLVDRVRWKGGTRVSALCGSDALDWIARIRRDEAELSTRLSTPVGDISPALARYTAASDALREENRRLKREAAFAALADVLRNPNLRCVFLSDADAVLLRDVALRGAEEKNGLFCACSGSDGEGYRYTAASVRPISPETRDEIRSALRGKGGGSGVSIQGRFDSSKEEICAYFNAIRDSVKEKKE